MYIACLPDHKRSSLKCLLMPNCQYYRRIQQLMNSVEINTAFFYAPRPLIQLYTVYKRIALLISTKLDKPYCDVMNYIRCQLSFSLLRSTISCLRGTRTKSFSTIRLIYIDLDLALAQGQVDDY